MPVLEDYRIKTVLTRAIEIIDDENKNLRGNIEFDISASNDNKGRCLHELYVLLHSLGEISSDHSEQIRILRKKLELNAYLLESYLAAARVVADLFKKKIQDIDADGTYSAG
ncbi:hypothetical protein [Candidatus Liberibacter americanus]|uniref:Uncharacterized protein n=1 Tax=Candidatus Liberibacter americanus str. Sao Paulo TaxID=1261131 RepID=U6B7R7_9HYPH|nr:hypothetical protein [Candidatus Liberibacter americanus]AHA27767.1 hypothetical protein lam_400 [Candidatus Liberibacter americanus str. Sao Paulo]EMS36152.1 hypothetical protein G653_02866 [Candidatus Liberibacter americanus PW_SP]